MRMHAVVGFLAQQPYCFQGLAVGARSAVQFDADPQAAPADFLDRWAAQVLQLLQEICAQFARSVSTIFSSTSTRSAVRATAQASGLPPNVLP